MPVESPEGAAFLRRLRVSTGHASLFSDTADWLTKNTTLNDQPFSFTDHEFQVQIVNDKSRRLVVRKASQIGMSEILVRKALAFLATTSNVACIYTLPSATFARIFAKGRIDPCIETSETLSALRVRGSDSSEFKQIGSSFLYIRGTFGQQQAISVPATLVINDELDFSNPTVVTTYASRLRHAEQGGFWWQFSTPTVNGFGVSAGFDAGTQYHYLAQCPKCRHWQAPDYFGCVRIPGFTSDVRHFTKEDLLNPRFDVDMAYIVCEKCGNPLDYGCAAREWVAKHPDRAQTSYQVAPWDLPKYNTVCGVIRQMANYERYADWVNFVLGLPYEDADNAFLVDIVRSHSVLAPVTPQAGARGCVLGLDVGKTSWVLIGRPVGKGLEVIWAEQISALSGEDALKSRVKELIYDFGVLRGVVDAGPDFSTALGLIDAFPEVIFACYYTRQGQKTLNTFQVDAENNTLNANRTKTLDALARKVNLGYVQFPKMDEAKIIAEHLGSLKRVEQANDEGEVQAKWVKVESQPDHYAHALNYLHIAALMLTQGLGLLVVPTPGRIVAARVAEVPSAQPRERGARLLLAERGRR